MDSQRDSDHGELSDEEFAERMDKRAGTILEESESPEEGQPTIKEIFGPGGMLEKCMPQGYEHRRSQIEMAEILEKAFQQTQHAIVEAGTGTGKTLGVLIPAIRSGKRMVISTATKSLQEQLFSKGHSVSSKTFRPEFESGGHERAAAISCAAQKFICMEGQPVLKGMDEVDWFSQICRLGKTHGNGRPRRTEFSSR